MNQTAVSARTSPRFRRFSALFLLVLTMGWMGTGAAFERETKITGSPTQANFGSELALDGDTLVVGVQFDDAAGFDAGTVFVFERRNGIWEEAQQLFATDTDAEDFFGGAVAIDGDTLLVGAPQRFRAQGVAYVFERSADGVWIETQKLTPSPSIVSDVFGGSVALAGDRAFVGAFGGTEEALPGAVFVFERTVGGAWNQVQTLTAPDGDERLDNFGVSLAVDGERLLVGDPPLGRVEDPTTGQQTFVQGEGAAYVFERIDGLWVEVDRLLASDGVVGDNFGVGLALDGDLAAIGAVRNTDATDGTGTVYLYQRSEQGWIEVRQLKAPTPEASDLFGIATALDGGRLVVGAIEFDFAGSQTGTGVVYVYDRSPGGSVSLSDALIPSDAALGDLFGVSVALDGDTVAALAPYHDNFRGAGYVFEPQPFMLSSGIYKPREKRLSGSLSVNGTTYTASIDLDQIRYGNGVSHKAYSIPAAYQVEPDAALAAVVSDFSCDLDGPGTRGFAGERPAGSCLAMIDGLTHLLVLDELRTGDRGPGLARRLIGEGRTVSGELIDGLGVGTGRSISLDLDVIEYGEDPPDRAYVRSQYAGHKFDLSQLEGSGIRIRQCDEVHPRGRGTDGFFGTEPEVHCTWKRGNGRQPLTNVGTVILR